MKGNRYTWSNKHSNNTFTNERLDRAVVNAKWAEMFRDSEVETVTTSQSDHKAIMLDLRQ